MDAGSVKWRVWFGVAAALVITVAWWQWSKMQIREMPAAVAPNRPAAILAGWGGAGGNPGIREQAELLDPAPLFFPTQWNYGQRPLPGALGRQADQIFDSANPKFSFPEQELKLSPDHAEEEPIKLTDVLGQRNEAPFGGFGHVDRPMAPLSERDGYLEVRSFAGDKLIIAQPLVEISIPRSDYAPLEFIVAVGAAGIVGEPMLARGSGWEEVDAFYRRYLVKSFRLGERLNPGSYRVVVGP